MMTLLAAVGVAKGWLGGYFFCLQKRQQHINQQQKTNNVDFWFLLNITRVFFFFRIYLPILKLL